MNRVLALAVAAAGGLVAGGCSPSDAVVAYKKVTDGGGAGSDGGPCLQSSDCEEGFFCSKADCLADGGTCQGRPAASDCPSEFGAACGCDGVKYWNDCLRRVAGVNPSNCLGQSTPPCQSSAECPGADAGAVCSKLGCGLPYGGICWVLPASCPADTIYTIPVTFERCSSPGECGLDLCSAIRSEEPVEACGVVGPDQ